MAYATASDVAVRWGRTPSTEEAALIEVRLSDVERIIRRRIPDLDNQVDSGTILEADVIQVEADAVLRLVRNPDGFASETDGEYTYVLSKELAPGTLSLTPEEWAILGITANGMFTISPRFEMPS